MITFVCNAAWRPVLINQFSPNIYIDTLVKRIINTPKKQLRSSLINDFKTRINSENGISKTNIWWVVLKNINNTSCKILQQEKLIQSKERRDWNILENNPKVKYKRKERMERRSGRMMMMSWRMEMIASGRWRWGSGAVGQHHWEEAVIRHGDSNREGQRSKVHRVEGRSFVEYILFLFLWNVYFESRRFRGVLESL